jgi:PQQ-like domain
VGLQQGLIGAALSAALLAAGCGGAGVNAPTTATAVAAATSEAAPVPVVGPALVTVDLTTGQIVAEAATRPMTQLLAVQGDRAILVQHPSSDEALDGEAFTEPVLGAAGTPEPVVTIDAGGTVMRFDPSGDRVLAELGLGLPFGLPVVAGVAVATVEAGTVGIDTTTGARRWRQPRHYFPVLPGTGVFVANSFEPPGVVALDAGTGKVRWRAKDTNTDVAVEDGVVVSVISSSSRSGNVVMLLDETTGAPRWTVALGASAVSYVGGTRTADAIWVVVENEDNTETTLLALAPRDGTRLREVPIEPGISESPTGTDAAVAVPAEDRLLLIEAATGAERWSLPGNYGTPVIVGDRLYAVRDTARG